MHMYQVRIVGVGVEGISVSVSVLDKDSRAGHEKLSANVNGSHHIPYVYAQGVNEGEGKPDKDAGVSEKVLSDVRLRQEGNGGTEKNPLHLALKVREGVVKSRHQ